MYKLIIENILSNSPENTLQKLSTIGMYSFENETSKLAELSKDSKLIDLYGRMSLINLPKLILPSCQIGLKLDFNSQNFIIIEGQTTSGSGESIKTESSKSILEILDVKVYMKHYELRENFALDIERILFKSPVIYEHKQVTIKHITLPQNISMYSSHNIYSGMSKKIQQ